MILHDAYAKENNQEIVARVNAGASTFIKFSTQWNHRDLRKYIIH